MSPSNVSQKRYPVPVGYSQRHLTKDCFFFHSSLFRLLPHPTMYLPASDERAKSQSVACRKERFDFEESDPPTSPTLSDSSIDEEEINRRTKPFWPKYCAVFRIRGFRLDTVKDARGHYTQQIQGNPGPLDSCWPVSVQEHFQDDDDLCPDSGFPDNLFRGTRLSDSKRVVVKAVHIESREYKVNCTLVLPPLKDDPMNHTIPILDLIEFPDDDLAFIVMEEWSSQLITSSGPCCMARFLSAVRQCIEHVVFMHRHRIAHLDISLRNIVTDYEGHYAYIDFELSRQFDRSCTPLVHVFRATEMPPECDRNIGVDPFKVDVWALAVLILRACKLTGYWVPELMFLLRPMLDEEPNRRPSAVSCLETFNYITRTLAIGPICNPSH